ncbi:MAG TPA: zf-HC2 domain-containing protein [Terriglobales bacterium]|jgi:hypothetical protein|nr:zf-HC2 domain-containing protein [Terriglobales bacterium]
MKPAPDRDAVLPPHLNQIRLVAYQDGELPRREMESARAHLESCWTCRSRLAAVQGSIESFLSVRKKLLPEPAVLSESRVEQFRQRLSRHAAAVAAVPLPFGERLLIFRNQLRQLGHALLQPRRAVLATLVAVCLLLAMFTDVLNTRVSADTVLRRAENYETAHSPASGQVTRTLVQVERIDRTGKSTNSLGTVVIVHDSATPATYVRTRLASGSIENAIVRDDGPMPQPALAAALLDNGLEAPLLQYLTAQRWVPDVSVAGFRRLIAGRGSAQASARRHGDTFELSYPFAPGHPSGITEASLLVSSRDYSPNRLSIVTSNRGTSWEYRLTRTSFSFEPRSVEVASLNSPADISNRSTDRSAPAPPLRKPVPFSYAGSHASEAEVAAAEALHRVDACLGEEINLFPMSDGSLLVQGLVDNSARREAIRKTLQSVSGSLRVEVFVPRELKSGSELYRPPDQLGDTLPAGSAVTTSATLADLSSTKMPLYEQLYRHFAQPGISSEETDKQVAVFSNEVVTLARQTFLHAWALKRLDREFSAERTSGLSATARQKVEQMRQDHRRWISTLAQRQTEMLSDIAGAGLAADMTQLDTVQQDSETLLHLAREQNDLVRALFTTSQQTPETASSLARLLVVLRRMGA